MIECELRGCNVDACGSHREVKTLKSQTEGTTLWEFRKSRKENRMLYYSVHPVLK